MTGDEMRELLAGALWRIDAGPDAPPLGQASPASQRTYARAATDLLPTVRAIAATELRAMADRAEDHGTVDEDWAVSADQLDARADELEAGAVTVSHVVPSGDLVEHETTDDCSCGPAQQAVVRNDGSVGWVVFHASLDGRERDE